MANSTEKTGFTEREEAIIAMLTRTFAGLMLDARIVDVHKQGGGTVPTVRFTLNEQASSDLERDRIESTAPIEELGEEVAAELKGQLPG